MAGARARVVHAKSARPEASSSTLHRPRLHAGLDVLLDPDGPIRTALVTAPAGFGKTTLLAEWAHRAADDGWAVAWCSLDQTDASCFRMWSSLLRALELAVPPDAAARIRNLSAPRAAGDADLVADLLDVLAGCRVVLVLENVHEVTDNGARSDLDYVLGHCPRDVAVVVSSRYAPSLSALHSARVAGRLSELRTRDLAFRRTEVAELCLDLPGADVDAVWERSPARLGPPSRPGKR